MSLPCDITGPFRPYSRNGPQLLIVSRARKIERFFSQPFFVAEQFTGKKGVYTPIKETLRSFDAIYNGEADSLPEQAFLYVGSIDDVKEKAKEMAK